MPKASFFLSLAGWFFFLFFTFFVLGDPPPGAGYEEALARKQEISRVGLLLIFLVFQGALTTGLIGLIDRRLSSLWGILLSSLWLFPAVYLFFDKNSRIFLLSNFYL